MACLLLAGVAGAQTQNGNGLISGDVSINYCRSDDQRSNTSGYHWKPALNLTVGRFWADNWLAGLSVSGRANAETREGVFPNGQPSRTSFIQRNSFADVAITPFVRRYWQFAPVQVFAGAGLSVGIDGLRTNYRVAGGTSQLTMPTSQQTSSLQVGPYVEAGVNYFLTNRLALQLSASTRSLPLNVAGLSTGLVYWTGTDRKAIPQEERDNAQTNRGNWIVEGGFETSRRSSDNSATGGTTQSSSRYVSISPSVGYFIGKNNLLGISLPMGFRTVENSDTNPSSSDRNSYWSVAISPYLQHYWTSTRLTPYTRLGATYFLFGSEPSNSDIKNVNVAAALNVGLAYMAGKRFIIETSLVSASVAYASSDGPERDNTSWDATLSGGLRGNFAVRYVLTRPR